MDGVSVEVKFDPESFKAFARNEGYMVINIASKDNPGTYWCECEVNIKPPLSLAPDKELNGGKSRVGILKAGVAIEKKVKLYTRPNNYPDGYQVALTIFMYGEDGAIAERIEKKEEIPCREV